MFALFPIFVEMVVATPVDFARGLSDPLQPNRLAALKNLKSWAEKSGKTHEFTPIEIDQLWRALQYTLWMADKRPVQQQVAAECVLLARSIDSSQFVEWNRGFWFNIDKIYENIDKYRVPKFQLLVRIYVAELFYQSKCREWDFVFVKNCMEGITSNLKRAVGANIQLMSVFLAELVATIETDNIRSVVKPRKVFHAFLKPAIEVVKKANEIPNSLLLKTLESVITDERVINYSEQTRELVKSTLKEVAMDEKTSQDVRDMLFTGVEKIDAIPVKESPKKKLKTN